MPYTLVAFHAHPDDESLLTGGTIARSAAQGHRVVLVVATSGGRGLAKDSSGLETRRSEELARAAAVLGVARTVLLGYSDSGFREPDDPPPDSFCHADSIEAATRLAAVLAEESADVLTVYDENGGYGHRDHRRVREVGIHAATMAGTPIVLAATVDRERLLRGVRLLHRLGIRPGGMTPDVLAHAFSAGSDITHEIDVRRWTQVKQSALRAHVSQTTGGDDMRTVRLLARLPRPVAGYVLGREWFVELGQRVPPRRIGDPFASVADPLRSSP